MRKMAERNYDLTKGGVKFDQDKPEWSLLPLKSCLEGVIRVLMLGAKKYTRHNWKAGMPWSRVLDATKRHLVAWEEGEDLDQETSLNHIDHALCELLFLRYYITHNVGVDDRYRRPVATEPTGINFHTHADALFSADLPRTKQDATIYLTSAAPQSVAHNIPASERLGYMRAKRLDDEAANLQHEDAEGDPNYWGV